MSLAPAAAGASIRTATSLGESSSCRSCSSNKNERSSSGRGFPGTNGSSELEHRRLHQMCHLRRLIPDPGQQQPGGPALLLPHALNFAQFGDGAGRFSQVLLVNPDPEKPARAKLTLTDNDGLPLVVDLNGEDVLEGQSSTILPQSLHSFFHRRGWEMSEPEPSESPPMNRSRVCCFSAAASGWPVWAAARNWPMALGLRLRPKPVSPAPAWRL